MSLLKYPNSNEDASSYTLLSFVKYSRYLPNSKVTEESTVDIQFPLPEQIPDGNSLNFEGEGLGIWGMGNPRDLDSRTGQAILDGIGSSMTNLLDDPAGLMGKIAGFGPGIKDSSIGARVRQDLGMIQNPHMVSIFGGVSLKTHDLSWKFSPKSAEEARTLKNITDTIKKRIYPAESDSIGFGLDYPDEIYVKYITNGNEDWIPSVRKAFVTSLGITYGGGGRFSMYKDGSPVETNISMSLVEVEIITRNELEETDISDPEVII